MLSIAQTMRSMAFSLLGQVKYQLFERRFIYTMRAGLILSALSLTALTVILLNVRQVLGLAIVGLVVALSVVIFIYHNLELSVFILMLATTVVNPVLPKDITVTLAFLLLILVIWLFKLLIAQRSFRSIVPAPPNKMALLFILAVVLSYIWSSFYVDPMARWVQEDKALPRLITGLVMIVSPLAMLYYGNMLRTMSAIKRVIWYYIGFSGVIMVIRLLNAPLPPTFNIKGQLPAWAAIFAVGQLLYNDKLNWIQRVLLIVLTSVWFYLQIGLGFSWLSGWLPLALGVIIVIFLRSRVLFLGVLLMGGVYVVANLGTIQQDFGAEQEESGNTRMSAGEWFIGINNEHLLFGTGPTGPYFYLIAAPPLLPDPPSGQAQFSHNNYIDIYSQTGVFGFVAWILLWLSVGWTTLKMKLTSPSTGFEAGLAASLFAIFPVTMLIMMLGDWVTPFTYTQTVAGISYTLWPWLWAGITIALYHRQRVTQS